MTVEFIEDYNSDIDDPAILLFKIVSIEIDS
jgi:hypothetical protein